MNNKHKKKNYDRFEDWDTGSYADSMAAIVIPACSFIFSNKYFDITATRAEMFKNVLICLIIFKLVLTIIDLCNYKYYGVEKPWLYKERFTPGWPDFWALLFLIANIVSCVLCISPNLAFSGAMGRGMGAGFMIVLCLTVIVVGRDSYVMPIHFMTLTILSAVSVIMAILQHFKFDIFYLRKDIAKGQGEKFISLFGNMNTYGSFLALSIPIFFAIFIFSKYHLWMKISSGIMLFIMALGVIPAKSDNVYLGVGLALVVLFYISVYYKKTLEFLISVTIFTVGLYVMAVVSRAYGGSKKAINGIAGFVENPKMMLILPVIMILITGVVLLFKKLNNKLYNKIQCKKTLWIITFLGIAFVAIVIYIGSKGSHTQIFKFDDDWGTYRGFIWKRSWRAFLAGTPLQKIFGYGNDMLLPVMKDMYYDEMIALTGKVYDNAHNEFLQYLVTLGIFGAVSYVGLVVSTFIYLIRRLHRDPALIALLVGIIGYLGAGLVYLNQPITTPFLFIMIALGVGHERHVGWVREDDDFFNYEVDDDEDDDEDDEGYEDVVFEDDEVDDDEDDEE